MRVAMSEGPDQAEGAAPLRVEHPRSIRALAHPARLAIINALATGEELTATQCAELTGLSPSATAYHLKFLERSGFAEAASPRPDRRERPWRATGRRIRVDLDGSTPAGASAAAAVGAAYFDTTREIAVEFTEGGHAEPEEWRDAVLNNADLWLTAEEFHRVAEELGAVLEPYRDRALPGRRPAGSRRVRVMNVVVPYRRAHPEPESPEA
jgi:DNA-binding transcriptional ArsR family regulator